MDAEIRYTIIQHEGGYVNNPADPGGETRWGISKAQYPSIDIQHLTLDEAAAIYARDYWRPLLLDQVNSMRLRWKIFDIAVQRGPVKAAMVVQGILGVPQDGKIGSQTIVALNKAIPTDLLYQLSYAQIDHYVSRVIKDSTQLVFLQGWINRAMDLGLDLVTT